MTLNTTDCKIAALALNGGLVQTIALLPSSPAINTGLFNNEQSPFDEWGVPKPQGAEYDIGVYEYIPS